MSEEGERDAVQAEEDVDLGPSAQGKAVEAAWEEPKSASTFWGNMARFRPSFLGGKEEDNLPDHLGPVKQLYCRTGYNLAVYPAGTVFGTSEPFNRYAVLELSSTDIGEVRIKGVETGLYISMDDQGNVYAKKDRLADDSIFHELYEGGYNSYLNKKHKDKGWYLGIKKSGHPKQAHRTARGQKAVQFLPRIARPPRH